MQFKIISMGCPKNLVESEYLTWILEKEGHTLSDDCDAVIVNTCAFISDAAKESIETIIGEAASHKKVIVAGCLVERYGDKLTTLLPEADLFVGRSSYGEIGTLVSKTGFFRKEGTLSGTFPRKVLTSKPTAYLKIQEGCDNRCSYCTVPGIRGGLQSRAMEDVREEFRWLLGNGFREINIIGQDITSYGKFDGVSLTELLSCLLEEKGDYYLRLLYMHPRGLSRPLIDLISREERIIKYMDIPIQHSEDRILTMMGRGYTKDYLEVLLGDIRDRMPQAVLRTTAIVGFPGETEKDFQGLADFVKKWGFDMLGAFMYSREEGTRASKLKGHLRKGTKQERYNALMSMQREISRKRLKRLEGLTMETIVEAKEGESMVGRLIIQAPDIDGVAFIKGACNIGEMREGKVVKTLDYDVIVEV